MRKREIDDKFDKFERECKLLLPGTATAVVVTLNSFFAENHMSDIAFDAALLP